MRRLIKVSGLIMLSMFLFCGCGELLPDTSTSKENNEKHVETVMYYKTVPVKITEIKKIWNSNRETTWIVSVKSTEYKLEDSFRQTSTFAHNDAYAYDLYRGKLEVGDTIYAEMNSWKKGDKVTKRVLSHLVEKD